MFWFGFTLGAMIGMAVILVLGALAIRPAWWF